MATVNKVDDGDKSLPAIYQQQFIKYTEICAELEAVCSTVVTWQMSCQVQS